MCSRLKSPVHKKILSGGTLENTTGGGQKYCTRPRVPKHLKYLRERAKYIGMESPAPALVLGGSFYLVCIYVCMYVRYIHTNK